MAEDNKVEVLSTSKTVIADRTSTKTIKPSRSARTTKSSSSTNTSDKTTGITARAASALRSVTSRKPAAPVIKKTSTDKKNAKTWSEKVIEKNKQIDKLLRRSRKFGGALRDGTAKEIKKRVSDDGPRGVVKMHMLGTARQRKELVQELERILDV